MSIPAPSRLRLAPYLAEALLLTLGWLPADLSGQFQGEPDLTSVDEVIEALYGSISGAAGEPRQWDLFHTLLHPTAARLISMGLDSQGEAVHRVMSPDEFVAAPDGLFLANGFFERELGFHQERFGNMVHRFSAYDSKRTLADSEPFSRGINSIQLLWSEGRWWAVTILWDRERPGNLIPAELAGR
ncbi:MAG: hypothetical protein WEA09_03755 [Gemmatimonadota bacterium]